MVKDPYEVAQSMIRMYGPGAVDEAEKFALKFRRARDKENAALWNRIIGFIQAHLKANDLDG